MNSSNANNALVWLRRDLRLYDQAALHHALAASKNVICTFIFDVTILDSLPRADRRVAFIWHSLFQLKARLIELGSDLLVRYGNPVDLIPQLANEFDVRAVYANRDTEPQAIWRDSEVEKQLREQGKSLCLFKDQVIFEKNEILTQTGSMFQVFTPYKRAWLAQLKESDLIDQAVQPYLTHFKKLSPERMPSLSSLGFDDVDVAVLKPGTEGGQALLDDFCRRIHRYHETRDFPGIKGVSYLSVHVRFGTVSIRHLVRTALKLGGDGALMWLSELIWREFYQQLLWHKPELVDHAFKPHYDAIEFPNNNNYFKAWCQAQTGFPLVDAAMRQLNQTGFMHNRLRMVTASFLVKDLLVDWRWGERYFAEKLNDFDLASNNGGWQWAASTGCDAQPYFRIFNPTTQSQRFDPEGQFIRRYCPELAHLNNKQIHAPIAYGSARMQNYPAPLVDHTVQRKAALVLFKQAEKE